MNGRPVVLAAVLAAAATAAGCASGLTPREARYQALYERVLTPLQLERYRSLRTAAEREAFIEVLAVGEQLRALEPGTEQAVLEGRVFVGMNQKQVLLAWGVPFSRVARAEGGLLKEVWIYTPRREASGREVGPRYAYFEDGLLVRTRDETPEPEPFDPVALMLMPFGELVKLVFGVATLPLAPFSQ